MAFERHQLSQSLRAKFGLASALVVPGPNASLASVALAAGRYFPDVLDPGDVVGVSWGETLELMAQQMIPRTIADLTVVQMLGSMHCPYIFTSESCSTNVALKLSGKVVNLYAPAALSTAEAAETLRSEPVIQEHFALLATMRKAVFAIGTMGTASHIVKSGIATPEDVEWYAAHGAVGVLCGRFIDGRGRHVKGPLDERMIGVTPERLADLDVGFLVAAGEARVAGVFGAMTAGYVTHIVTDEPTAQTLLETVG
ncbi:sugar-binding transcriptional regulator [Jiella flava]|uniref:sugar-binding transcriptional regulator n=1 Tax=Jiella flava TaxID=2816857 RepID=UPI001E4642EE|nr:sugar-binding domain-containing protein [Jiella flava]